MKSPSPEKLADLLLLCCVLFTLSFAALGQDKEWRPISAEELSARAPAVESDADAEAIFWEVRIDDSDSEDLSLRHYVRVKIFTERGREKYSKLDVPFSRGMKIKDLAARVTRPDGSSVEIGKEDIFEREIVKAGGIKVKAKSFAVPNIEPGVIVEYRYKEALDNSGAMGMRLAFQRDIPIQKLSYYYKPYNAKEPKYQSYNFTDTKFVKDKNGYWLAERVKVPAFREEPRMPPEDTVRPWMLLTGSSLDLASVSAFGISFVVKDPSNPQKYWAGVSGQNGPMVKWMNKSSGDIKKTAAELTAGASTPDEKLRKIYEFCQREIRNVSFDTTMSDEEKRKLPKITAISEVLKQKAAKTQHIDMLFGALASAAGFESRIALLGNRSEMFFHPEMANENLVHPGAIAVKVGEKYKLFNPGLPFLPYGMLAWYEEDTFALLVGEKDFLWERTPLTGHDTSTSKRTGKFKLLEDGTLEGTVRIERSGHPALNYRLDKYDESPAKREESLKEEIKAQMSTAEVSDIMIENLTDASKPLIHQYRVRVPGYAQRTGKRLFLQPGFFEYGSGAVFSSASRKYDIFFRYPWSEADTVEIELPKDFDLDNGDTPGTLADPQKIGSLDIRMRIDKGANLLKYERKFYFGGGGNTLFPADSYRAVKQLFDVFHQSDIHTITLKQK